VSRSDLRTLFRSNQRGMKAVDVFADREGEWAVVADSLAAVTRHAHSPDFDVEDLESPRRNVLSFYGVGGIGKTTLSKQIALHLSEDGAFLKPVTWLVGRPARWRATLRIR
jgi:signal recognition particle GTPase